MNNLIKVPDPLLRQKSKPVIVIDSSIIELAKFMESQLKPLEMAGAAAPQFGELVRVIVIRVDTMTNLVIVNPKIVKEKGICTVIESCHSIPNRQYWVKRPKIVKLTGMNLDGVAITIKGRGFLAQILKHEVNHLDGILIDSIGKLTNPS